MLVVRSILLLALVPILSTCASSGRARAAWAEVEGPAPVRLVSWSGSDAETEKPVFHAFLDDDRFQSMWTDVVTSLGSARRPTGELRPAIDFTRCVGFALTAGITWNSNGYTLRSIEKIDGEWHARLDQITYQSKSAGDRTRPYGIFLLTRVPGATIVVEENVADLIGAPPQWKERGRFTVPSERTK
jgi:hypothetical protein